MANICELRVMIIPCTLVKSEVEITKRNAKGEGL